MTSQWKKGRRRAESVAEDAWDHLVSAVGSARSAGHSAKGRAYDFADEASSRYSTASDRVGTVTDEAFRRATLAYDALAGRTSQRKQWGWIAVALLGGIAVGWAVAASAPKAIEAAQERYSDTFGDNPDEIPPTIPTSRDVPAPYRVVE